MKDFSSTATLLVMFEKVIVKPVAGLVTSILYGTLTPSLRGSRGDAVCSISPTAAGSP